MMKQVLKMAGMAAVAGLVGFSGKTQAQETESEYMAGLWAKPISNPVYTDLAMQKREVNVVYMYQSLPSHLEINLGNLTPGGPTTNLPFDGNLQAVAIQAEIPFADGWSFVADKSGYINFNPENDTGLFDSEDGLANLAAGVKWAFWQKENNAAALRGTIEVPTGDSEVFQGNGRGSFSPALLLTHIRKCYALNGVLGATLPFDSSELSTMGYAAVSGAWRVTEKLSGHVELNWFRVLEAGHGEADFNNIPDFPVGPGQTAEILPNVAEFEGGDLINLGASNSEKHPDFVSMAIGARYQLTNRINVGLAYEQPLSTKDRGLMDERVTVDLGMTF